MTLTDDFVSRLEAKVREQLCSQRVGYLLGAGSSYLGGDGYPLASEMWEGIRDFIDDKEVRDDIQNQLDGGVNGLEEALDSLDDGGAQDTLHRHVVTNAIAQHFGTLGPPLALHESLVQRFSHRPPPSVEVFTLNYDPLLERAAESVKVRLVDGFTGLEHAFFHPGMFEERIGRVRGTHRARQFDLTARPIHLYKLHGSVGWYECVRSGIRRCPPSLAIPASTKRLMIPPQRRKAAETMTPPYATLWSQFRSSLCHGPAPLNRLAYIGYGFADEHVNAVIENALGRTDFTLLIFTKSLCDEAWRRWGVKNNVVVVTEVRCSLKGEIGPGHPDLWSFERLCKEA